MHFVVAGNFLLLWCVCAGCFLCELCHFGVVVFFCSVNRAKWHIEHAHRDLEIRSPEIITFMHFPVLKMNFLFEWPTREFRRSYVSKTHSGEKSPNSVVGCVHSAAAQVANIHAIPASNLTISRFIWGKSSLIEARQRMNLPNTQKKNRSKRTKRPK